MTPRDENLALCLADDTARPPIEVEIGIFLSEVHDYLVDASDRAWLDRYNTDPDFRGRIDEERQRDLEQAEADFRDQDRIARSRGY